ncbi:SAM-dependent methyltransferase [Treponema denticola]|nr:SAM-dependent methyltransferase [Treponema denticola]
MMECVLCRKKELSKTRCEKGHYVCNECHTKGMDSIIGICLNEKSKNPIEIIEKLMAAPFCHMHGPEHHVMVGSALLTAYKNAGGDIDLEQDLIEMQKRGKSVPGGVCGFWGACGAGISTGIFLSIISKSTPLENEPWGLSNKMTSKSLEAIGNIGGPRCCKRDSYVSLLTAIDFIKKIFNINMEKSEIHCTHYKQNNQCIGARCPFRN